SIVDLPEFGTFVPLPLLQGFIGFGALFAQDRAGGVLPRARFLPLLVADLSAACRKFACHGIMDSVAVEEGLARLGKLPVAQKMHGAANGALGVLGRFGF